MWNEIKTVWAEAWATAKSNWKLAWDNSKAAIISFFKAIAAYVKSILETVIMLPLYTGIVKTGKIIVMWVINKITRA